MGAFVEKENLEMPEMYPEIMQRNPIITVNIPSTSNEGPGETTIVVEPVVNNIKQSWATKYKIKNPTLDLESELENTYNPIETTENRQTQIR
jgi:hypothetical protein